MGTVPQSPRVYNQGTTLGQTVKGRDSISLPGMQLDPVGTQAVPGTREWDSQEVCWDKGAAWMGATVEKDPWDQDGNTPVSLELPQGAVLVLAPCLSAVHVLPSVPRAPAPASSPCSWPCPYLQVLSE